MILINLSIWTALITITPSLIILGCIIFLYIFYREEINNLIRILFLKLSKSSIKEISVGNTKLTFNIYSGLIPETKNSIQVPSYNYSVIKRVEFIIQNNVHIRTLWIEDQRAKISRQMTLLKDLGMKIEHVDSSDIALKKLKANKYDLIISDIQRDDNETEGIRFLKELVENHKITTPMIFYTGEFKDSDGYPKQTPRYAFGVACMPYNLLLLCLDILERNIKEPNIQ